MPPRREGVAERDEQAWRGRLCRLGVSRSAVGRRAGGRSLARVPIGIARVAVNRARAQLL
jgi:hypothetical protein